MRLHMNKRLAEILFFALVLLCMYVQGQQDTEFIHRETVENQQKMMGADGDPKEANMEQEEIKEIAKTNYNINPKKGRLLRNAIPVEATDANESSDSNNTAPVNNATSGPDKSFWTGCTSSLLAIFFVEFGDRVIHTFNSNA